MLDHANIAWQSVGYTRADRAAAGRAARVLPADGAHRRAHRDPLRLAVAADRGDLLPGPDDPGGVPGRGPADQPLRPAAGLREAAGRDRGRGGRGRTGAGGRLRQGAAGRPAGRRAARGRPAAAGRARRGLGAGGRGRVRAAAAADRAGPAALLLRRRRAAAGRRAALLPRGRAAVLRDLRDEREQRRHDLGPVPGEAGHGRPAVPGRGGAAARRRRGDLPGRHRLPRLPGRPGAHRGDLRRRRLAAHRGHRPASTTRATCPSWTGRRS